MRARAAFVACVALAAASRARAGEPAAPVLEGAWSTAERGALATALGGVPAVVRARLPRVVARDAGRCDAEGFPVDDDELVDDAGRAHVCPGVATPELVARRVVTTLLFGFERRERWSEEPGWRRQSRWAAPLGLLAPRAENVAPEGFAAPRGRRSPRWDLTTHLVATWLDAAGADGGVACRLMSQAAFVRARLATLGAAPAAPRCRAFEAWADLDRLVDVEVVLAAPSTAMVGSLFGHLFLRLVYRDEDGAAPAHLSRTVAFLADNDVPFEDDRAYAWKGIAGFYTASLHERMFLDAFREYGVTEGRDLRRWRVALTPGERAALMERIWTVAGAGRYAYYFFRQNCATLMMDLVADALPPARAIAGAGLVASPPASTLEAWAVAPGADGPLLAFVPEPVPSFDHEARVASRHREGTEPALVATTLAGERAALAAALAAARSPEAGARVVAYARLAGPLSRAGDAGGVRAWLDDSAAVETSLSVAANLRAEAAADTARRAKARAARDALAADLVAEARAAGDARLGRALGLVGDDERELRVDGYRALRALVDAPGADVPLSERLRLLALLESEVRYDVARLRREPELRDALLFPEPELTIAEQPYARAHAELVRPPVATVVAPPLRELQRTKEAIFAARELPAAAAPTSFVAASGAEYDASLSRSGIDQASVAVGVVGATTALAPALGVGGALYDEQLGDHRRFGFPSDTALVVARSEVWLAWLGRGDAGSPAVLAYEARALGYRSLRRPLPEGDAARTPLGWEAFVDVDGSRARALTAEVRAAWGALAPLVDRGELATHLLAAVDLEYLGLFPSAVARRSGAPQAVAAPLGLEVRAPLGVRPSYRSWLAARARVEPALVVAGAPRTFALGTSGVVEAHVALRASSPAGAHDPALVARLEVARTTLSVIGARADTQALLALGVELR